MSKFKLKPLIYIIIFISIIDAIAQFSLKKGNNNNDLYCIYIAGILYFIMSYFLYNAYKHHSISFINLIWSCISINLAIISGIIFFDEKFNLYKLLSVILAFLSIYINYLSN